MNKHEKAIEAANYLKEYCGSLKECKRCVFKRKYRNMIYCKLEEEDPATWDIDTEVDQQKVRMRNENRNNILRPLR